MSEWWNNLTMPQAIVIVVFMLCAWSPSFTIKIERKDVPKSE